MAPVTRDRVIVFGIVALLILLAASRHVLTISSSTAVFLLVAFPSIILHEVSHGIAALACGDDTAKRAGRITLNPLRHVDLFGTLLLPALLAVTGHSVFGYAKPVPVNATRMRHPRNQTVLVSLAGPVTNIGLAVIAGLWLRFSHLQFISTASGPWRVRILFALGEINVFLAVFNLIPIPPLDGSAVVTRVLPKAWEQGWATVQRYGMIIVLAIVLLEPQALARLFNPALRLWFRLLQ
jgi:Zn-dependent protease